MNKFYAYSSNGQKGIVNSWDECLKIVKGTSSKYKKFKTKEEAQYWLDNDFTEIPLDKGIYFDAGTGHGNGTEVRVTDEKKNNLLLLNKIIEVNANGNVHLIDKTNNFGELLGCFLALTLADKLKSKIIFGDSKLVIDYWSKGLINNSVAEDTRKLAFKVRDMRSSFENDGGIIKHISGDKNPADLGFHK